MNRPTWIIAGSIAVLAAAALAWWRGSRADAGGSARRDTGTVAGGKAPPGSAKGEPKEKAIVTLRKVLENGEIPRLAPEQLRALVEKHGHDAASLLAAWQLGQDSAWLDEAVERHPDDPRVLLAKLSTFKELNGDAKAWIERLKQNDPGNSVGWCYEALSEFKGGSTEAARTALAEAAKRARFDGYSKDAAPLLAEAYLGTGMDPLAAEILGGFSIALPQLSTGMNVAREAVAKLGPNLDDATVQDILALAKTVRGADGTGYLITDLVSMSMERKTLAELSVMELVPGTKTFVMERLAELDAEKSLIKDLTSRSQPLLLNLDDSELRQYFKRVSVEGEKKAMQWLLARHPEGK